MVVLTERHGKEAALAPHVSLMQSGELYLPLCPLVLSAIYVSDKVVGHINGRRKICTVNNYYYSYLRYQRKKNVHRPPI